MINILKTKKELNDIIKLQNKEQDEYIKYWQEQYDIKQEQIDKAIEYLECALSEDKETPSKYNDWRLDLLEILKGDDNNE